MQSPQEKFQWNIAHNAIISSTLIYLFNCLFAYLFISFFIN